ncbi:D-alanine--D-alanine ligase family protein [Lentzea sp. DG1S-22]|uniref:D-alanine--D-alanine ligase family protein n=1 Tax=Lentzea sp. DG1S-22 TaxID=3108822 RepID=UPI002E77AC39|nr:D-alanine--D-alanine ligase family protein [Lentzea sp. DG1S-22]WVH80182.1 D-alanine--D-alanine ligase family protein [Lentzea sp. DG1S-22]
MTQRKTRVAVVFGGRSSEHEVSCQSAKSVLPYLDPDRFEVVPVGITPQGQWALGTDPNALEAGAGNLPTLRGRSDITPVEPGQALKDVDVVFPLLHGAWGEDGTIQGLLELGGVPYVGPGVFASAAAMDKVFAKKILQAAGLDVGRFVALDRSATTLTLDEREHLGLPVFVKPSRAGSSVGISKVNDWADLDAAIFEARQHDPKVIVEAAVANPREIELAVLEFPDGRVEASLPAELRPVGEGADWYDFEAKYVNDSYEADIPAKLDDETTARVRELAVTAFKALDCQGLSRVDFFLTEQNELIVNELNTMPGFTPISMYPKAWDATGIDFPTLLTTLVETAIARGSGLR